MIAATGINSIDSLVYSSWKASAGQAVSLSYSFLTQVPAGATADDANGFKPMTAVQRDGVREALASWAAALASALYFSALQQGLALQAWLIIIFLCLTVPVTTIMLARTALFRTRTGQCSAEEQVPPALSQP